MVSDKGKRTFAIEIESESGFFEVTDALSRREFAQGQVSRGEGGGGMELLIEDGGKICG